MMIDVNKDKLLIIHVDDLGMAQAVNSATVEIFEKGIAKSASVMIPAPYARDFVKGFHYVILELV